MLLIQMHKLETLNLLGGVKSQSGVIWGHRGQILIFTKNALPLLCYQVYSCNSYTCITFAGKQGNWGQSGVDVSKPAGYAVCDGNMSSSFFFLATRLFRILPYIRFWPNLVKVTGTLTTTQAQTMVGSEVTMGSLGSKRSFSSKRHQVLQNT